MSNESLPQRGFQSCGARSMACQTIIFGSKLWNHPMSAHLWMRLTLIRLLATLSVVSILIDLAYITWQNQPRSEVMTTDGTLDRESKTRLATEGHTYLTRSYEEPLRRDTDGSGRPVKVPDVSRQDNFSSEADAHCLMY